MKNTILLEEAKDRLIKPKMLKDVKYTNEDFAKAIETILNLIEKQQKLINIFIHNEAVKEGKDFNEIKEKYYECLYE